ncbi:MAG: hypothetical protein Kow0098_16040 [Ignavibacteriaceae bacterium]
MIFRKLTLAFIFLLIAADTFAQGYEVEAEANRWKDNRLAAFTFTFDDGFLSHYTNAFPILENFGFKGTFFVIPPSLTDTLPGIWRYGSWQQFIEMSDSGHEIASHSMTHPHLTNLPLGDTLTPHTIEYELYQSKIMIEQKIPGVKCISFAYPYSELNPLVRSITKKYYENGRAVGLIPNLSVFPDSVFYKLNSKLIEFSLPRQKFDDDFDEYLEFTEWFGSMIDSSKWGIFMIHEVFPYDSIPWALNQGSYFPIANEWLIKAADFIRSKSDNDSVWVETMGNVTRYIRERNAFSYQVLSKEETFFTILPSDTLNDEIYNYPLTVDVSVPDEWDIVFFQQGNNFDTLTSFLKGETNYVRTDIIPDGGIAVFSNEALSSLDLISAQPEEFLLYQNYPNPFNPVTRIKYSILSEENGELQPVKLVVYNALGEEIDVLVDEKQSAGIYEISFDGSDLPSGVFLYKLSVGKNYQTKKFILVK